MLRSSTNGTIGETAQSVARIFAAICAISGVAVLACWTLGLSPFRRYYPGLVAMNPVSATLFIVAAVALLIRSTPPDRTNGLSHIIAQACSTLLIAVGTIKAAAYAVDWHFHIRELLFTNPMGNQVNRMAPNTALAFALIGVSLLLLDVTTKGGLRVSDAFALAAALISFIAIVGYLYRIRSSYQVGPYIPMAPHTAVALHLLAIGTLTARGPRGVAAIFFNRNLSGKMARWLFPGTVAAFVLLGWLRIEGERRLFFDRDLGVTLYTTASIIIFAILIGWAVRWIERSENALRTSARHVDQLNDELKRRADQLEGVNKELEAFSYSVSHDLRAPLRHVIGYSELLTQAAGDSLSDKARRYVRTIREASTEMATLIDDLLAFSRMSRIELHESAVPLGPLVAAIARAMQRDAAPRNVILKISDLPTVQGDASMLKLVFLNLLDNAFKYSRDKDPAVIEVGLTATDNDSVTLCVRDNGAGFDMQYADKLFGVFQRLHRSDEFEGTGVGLATTQRIILRHRGRIWAESKLNEGAAFYISLKKQSPTAD